MSRANPGRLYFPGLNGLRFAAAALVMVSHIEQLKKDENLANLDAVTWIGKSGDYGVSLFFVLSGFLITFLLLQEDKVTGDINIRKFYTRRILRIWPLYYLIVLLGFFVLPYCVQASGLENVLKTAYWQKFLLFLFFLPNLAMVAFPQVPFTAQAWSIGTEEQFYLIWPWIILMVKIPQKLITLLLCILTGLLAIRIVVWLLHIETLPYETMYKFTRIDSLCAGSILAAVRFKAGYRIRFPDKLMGVLLAISILLVLPAIKLIFNARLPYFVCCFYPLIGLFWVSIVNSSLQEKSFLFKIFNNTILRFFGKISYGLYIFHWPVYMLFESKTPSWSNLYGLSSFTASLLAAFVSTALSVILALISYYCIEIHFLKLKRFFISEQRP